MAEQIIAEDVVLRKIDEVTPGTTPTDGVWEALPYTSESLSAEPTFVEDPTIISHRQLVGQRKTGLDPNGSITAALRLGDYDDIIEAGMGGTWATDVLKIGSTKRSFSIEKDFSATITNAFLLFTGMEVATLQFTLNYGAIGELVVGFEGLNGVTAATSAVGIGSTTAAGTADPLDADDGITTFELDGSASNAIVTGVNFTVAQGTQAIAGLGSAGRKAVNYGAVAVSGTVDFYIGDASWAQFVKKLADTEFSMQVVSTQGTDSFDFLFPAAKWNTGQPQVPGRGQSVMCSLGFVAKYDATEASSLTITRTT